jgi:hypothetical protein
MPTRYHLFNDAANLDNYILNMTFLHDFTDILAENYTLKVILPEGASNIKVLNFFNINIILLMGM